MELISFQGFLILAVLGVLLFGERLPEVAGKFAKQFMELKKSLQGIRDEIQSVAFDAKHAVTHSLDKVDELSREEAHCAQVRTSAGRTGRQWIDCGTARNLWQPSSR